MTLWCGRKYKADPIVVLYLHSPEPLHCLDLKLNVNLNISLIVSRKIAKSAELETEMMSAVISSDIVLLFF